MKKTVFKAVSVILASVFVVMSLCSCSMTDNAPQYKDNADGCALYRYKSSSTQTELTVPDTYDGKTVTELMAFSVANAEYLEKLNIGANIKTIDKWAMTNCPVLKEINVSEDNPYFTSVDGVLYNKDMTVLLVYPNGKAPLETNDEGKVVGGGEFTVPETVKEIGENAFYICSNLRMIKFSDSIEKISDKAFIKCGNLAELSLPSSLKEIGADAFSYCDSLKSVEIPSNVQKIGDYAFFSAGTAIEKIIVHADSENDIELGTKWLPNKKGKINDTVKPEFVGRK